MGNMDQAAKKHFSQDIRKWHNAMWCLPNSKPPQIPSRLSPNWLIRLSPAFLMGQVVILPLQP